MCHLLPEWFPKQMPCLCSYSLFTQQPLENADRHSSPLNYPKLSMPLLGWVQVLKMIMHYFTICCCPDPISYLLYGSPEPMGTTPDNSSCTHSCFPFGPLRTVAHMGLSYLKCTITNPSSTCFLPFFPQHHILSYVFILSPISVTVQTFKDSTSCLCWSSWDLQSQKSIFPMGEYEHHRCE